MPPGYNGSKDGIYDRSLPHKPFCSLCPAVFDYLAAAVKKFSICLTVLPFPGNIRELKNLVERTLLVSGKSLLQAEDFERQGTSMALTPPSPSVTLDGLTLDELERQSILRALDAHGGNLSHVASALGISRAALYRRLEKYGIPVEK